MDAAAQSFASKASPATLSEVLDGLRSLSVSTSNNYNFESNEGFTKKYNIPFDTVIDSNEKNEKPFLACYYNRIGNDNTKYRSPWTNTIHTIQKDGTSVTSTNTTTTSKMNEKLRAFEKSFNDVWDSYKNLYYGHGNTIGSVYLKETSNSSGSSFQGMFGIRKRCDDGSKWDSVSYVIVDEPTDKECTYRVETYVFMVLIPTVEEENVRSSEKTTTETKTSADISLTMSKEAIVTLKVSPDKIPIHVSHIENIGTIIEENEMEIRSVMETVYIPKNYETLVSLQKQPQPKLGTNPVMSIMIDSGTLKKRLAATTGNNAEDSITTTSTSTPDETTTTSSSSSQPAKARPKGIPAGMNPLMASAMNSKILLKKKQQQQES